VTNALQAGQEVLGLQSVAVLPPRWVNTDRQADRIDDRVQLGRQPAARTTDCGSFSPCLDMLSTGSFAPLASA
jgi:hypothetical protein